MVVPKGDAVSPRAADFSALLEILKKAHALNYIHRDVRLSNFFRIQGQVRFFLLCILIYPVHHHRRPEKFS